MLIQPKNPDELKLNLAERTLVLFGMGGLGQRIADYLVKESQTMIKGLDDIHETCGKSNFGARSRKVVMHLWCRRNWRNYVPNDKNRGNRYSFFC